MLTRRAFVQAFTATLAALGWVRSAKAQAPTYRRYRVDHIYVAVNDADWGGKYRVSLWDGERFIKVVNPQHLGRAIIVPTWTREGSIAETSFKITSAKMDEHGLSSIKAQYESGPKWWLRG